MAALRNAWKKVVRRVTGEPGRSAELPDSDLRWVLHRLKSSDLEEDFREIQGGNYSLAERCAAMLSDGGRPSDAVFVERAYRRILSREPDEPGMRGYIEALASGRLTRAEVVDAFLASAEFQRLLLRANRESLETRGDSWASRMERDWDERAGENALLYIVTGHSESEEAFERSGEWDLENHILAGIELDPGAAALEIGCGIGRLMKPLARRVACVIGVDISGEMVRRARARLAALPNVQVHRTDGGLFMLDDSSVDFCYSFVVFQHFPAKEFAFAYFREVARVLRPGGVFRFQVNQRPERFSPGHVTGTWEGVGLGRAEVAENLEQCGFRVLDAWGEQTHYAWYTAEARARERGPAGARVRVRPAPRIDANAIESFFERMGRKPGSFERDSLLSGRLAWRTVLEPLLVGWAELSDDEFVSRAHRLLLAREIDSAGKDTLVSQLRAGLLVRTVFLDCLASSGEFRAVLAGRR